jgi:hypothetical protein
VSGVTAFVFVSSSRSTPACFGLLVSFRNNIPWWEMASVFPHCNLGSALQSHTSGGVAFLTFYERNGRSSKLNFGRANFTYPSSVEIGALHRQF